MRVSNGIVKVGDAVSAEKEGHIVEGNVFGIQEFGHKEVDPTWEGGTIIIKDHESKKYSHWQPKNVVKL